MRTVFLAFFFYKKRGARTRNENENLLVCFHNFATLLLLFVCSFILFCSVYKWTTNIHTFICGTWKCRGVLYLSLSAVYILFALVEKWRRFRLTYISARETDKGFVECVRIYKTLTKYVQKYKLFALCLLKSHLAIFYSHAFKNNLTDIYANMNGLWWDDVAVFSIPRWIFPHSHIVYPLHLLYTLYTRF